MFHHFHLSGTFKYAFSFLFLSYFDNERCIDPAGNEENWYIHVLNKCFGDIGTIVVMMSWLFSCICFLFNFLRPLNSMKLLVESPPRLGASMLLKMVSVRVRYTSLALSITSKRALQVVCLMTEISATSWAAMPSFGGVGTGTSSPVVGLYSFCYITSSREEKNAKDHCMLVCLQLF